jgi:hypothetical protein
MQSELNNILKGTNYSLKIISWNDVSRYTSVGGGLSSVGSNITDVKLVGKNGQSFFTIRTDNWNEKVGTVSAQDVAVIIETENGLTPITLKKYLQDNGLSSGLDDKVSIRFQTTFLPIEDDDHGVVEFCTDSYSYNTPDPSDPKNLLLLCTTQGLTLHTNKDSHQKLFLHSKDSNGKLINRWLEAEETDYKVGAEQIETDKQVEENMKRGKASSGVIGTKAMGQRFNALLTVQIPLKQKERPVYRGFGSQKEGCSKGGYASKSYGTTDDDDDPEGCSDSDDIPMSNLGMKKTKGIKSVEKTNFFESKNTRGSKKLVSASRSLSSLSSAARVSKGSVASETAVKVDTSAIQRSESEHITITVILYHVVKGGIPALEDVIAAVSELDQLYSSCVWSGNLKDISHNNVIPSPVKDAGNGVLKESDKFINRTSFPVG